MAGINKWMRAHYRPGGARVWMWQDRHTMWFSNDVLFDSTQMSSVSLRITARRQQPQRMLFSQLRNARSNLAKVRIADLYLSSVAAANGIVRFWQHMTRLPERHLDSFRRFCTANTHRHTDHATRDICSKRPHRCTVNMQCGRRLSMQSVCSVNKLNIIIGGRKSHHQCR